MSYSRSMKQKQNKLVKRIVISWAIVFMLGLVLGIISGVLIGKATHKEADETERTIFFYR